MTDELILERPLAARIRLPREPARPRVSETEDEDDDDEANGGYRAFGLSRGRQPPMLEFRLRTGDSVALGYPWLLRVRFDRSIGLTLWFGEQRVILRGRNLEALHAAIIGHRARWVREADIPTAQIVPEAEPLVEAIVVEE